MSTILYGEMGLSQAEHSVYTLTTVCTHNTTTWHQPGFIDTFRKIVGKEIC